MKRIRVLVPILLAGFGVMAVGQQKAPQPKSMEDKAFSADPMTGKDMYHVFCATCHGEDGKGKGPAAPALKAALPDLSQLTKKNGGQFPLMKVEQVIQGDVVVLSHGSREMPIYGDLFRGLKLDENFVKLRVSNLTKYIESIQVK